MKLLNFRDKILWASWAIRDLLFQKTRLLIFPDYSAETQKLRKSFDQVKVAL